jgi:inner membrane protein
MGLIIATAFGYRGKKRWIIGFISMVPDLDVVTGILLSILDHTFGLDITTHNQLFLLLAHREFSHSILMFAFYILIIAMISKDRRFTGASSLTLLSHFLMDYLTTWKMRPFYPFTADSSTLGVMNFFDPVITSITIFVIPLVIIDEVKSRGRWKRRFNGLEAFWRKKGKRLMIWVLLGMVVYSGLHIGAKRVLVNALENEYEAEISFADSYPIVPYVYVSAFSVNSTHYKVIMTSLLTGKSESILVQKYRLNHFSEEEVAPYAARAMELYTNSLPGEIDYPVIRFREIKDWAGTPQLDNVTIDLFDARIVISNITAYYNVQYRFEFRGSTDEFRVFIKEDNLEWSRAPNRWFE